MIPLVCVQWLLAWIFHLLCFCLQKKTFHHSDANDSAMGHMLVLMQYDWPKEENLFFEVIKKIKKEGAFAYPIFFHYIVCILFTLATFVFCFVLFCFLWGGNEELMKDRGRGNITLISCINLVLIANSKHYSLTTGRIDACMSHS